MVEPQPSKLVMRVRSPPPALPPRSIRIAVLGLVLAVTAIACGLASGAQSSRSLGLPWAGRLVGGVPLGADGNAFFTWDAVRERSPNRVRRRYANPRLLSTLERVLADYAAANPDAPRVGIGDLSRPRGGEFGSRFGGTGHASHQNGLDVDVYYPRRDRPRASAPRAAADRPTARAGPPRPLRRRRRREGLRRAAHRAHGAAGDRRGAPLLPRQPHARPARGRRRANRGDRPEHERTGDPRVRARLRATADPGRRLHPRRRMCRQRRGRTPPAHDAARARDDLGRAGSEPRRSRGEAALELERRRPEPQLPGHLATVGDVRLGSGFRGGNPGSHEADPACCDRT